MSGLFIFGDTHRHIGDERIAAEEPDSEQTVNFMQLFIAIITSLCSCTTGFVSTWSAPALPSMTAPGNTFTVNREQSSWIGSLLPLSAIIGGSLGGPLIDAFGRQAMILFSAIPFITSFLMIAFANDISLVYGGRVLSGFFVGVCSLALPIYLGETMLPKVRGTLGLLPTVFGNIGMLLCCVIGTVFDWRMLSLIGTIIPVVYFVGMFVIPETPQWYISKEKHREGRRALRYLRGSGGDICSEYAGIESSNLADKNRGPPSVLDIFSVRYFRPLFISLGLMFFQQMSGINAFMFYTVDFFKEAGGTMDVYLSTIIVNIVNIAASFVATLFIDVAGRKVLLSISSFTMAIMLFSMGTYFYYKARGEELYNFNWVPLFTLIVFIIGFSIGFGPIPWLMMGEVLPAKIRGLAASIGTAFNMLCAFFITKMYASMVAWIGIFGCCTFYAVMCVFAFVFVVVVVPETKGLSLEDIEKQLSGIDTKIHVRRVKRFTARAFIKPFPVTL